MKLKALLSLLLVACLLLSPVAVMEDDPSIEVIEETSAEPVVEDETVEGEAEEVATEPDEEVIAEAVDEIVEEEELDPEDDFVFEEISEEDEFELTDEEEEAEPELMAAEAEGVAIDETNFPDEYFRHYIMFSVDDPPYDGILTAAETGKVTELDLAGRGIRDLKGIEFFPNLAKLNVRDNNLDRLDLSGNPALRDLECFQNHLEYLDISGNLELEALGCSWNLLETLDVSKNTKLEVLVCADNRLTALDTSNNTRLRSLYCSGNKLDSLDLRANSMLEWLRCEWNNITTLDLEPCPTLIPYLQEPFEHDHILEFGYDETCISVDDTVLIIPEPARDTIVAPIDEVYFPVTDFRDYVSACYDWNKDNQLSKGESLTVHSIHLDGEFFTIDEFGNFVTKTMQYQNLIGIEYFSKLRELECIRCGLVSLDVSGCTELEKLHTSGNPLVNLDVSGCTDLKKLECGGTQLASLDISACTALEQLNCCYNQLTSLDVSAFTALEWLDCTGNKLSRLDISNCPKLVSLVKKAQPENTEDTVLYAAKDDGGDSLYLHFDKTTRLLTGVETSTPTPTPTPTPAPTATLTPMPTPTSTPKATVKATPTPAPTPTPKPTLTPMPTITVAKKSAKATVNAGTQYKIDLNGAMAKSFKSSKKKVATVDKDGVVTPKAPGKAKITIKIGKKKRTLTLTVKDPTIPNKVTLNLSGTQAAKKGTSVTLTATLPAGTSSGIKWQSSNKKIATVNNGVVTFKKKGKVTITATATRGKKKAKVKFKVSN